MRELPMETSKWEIIRWYNQPVKSKDWVHKKVVLARKWDKTKLVRYWAVGYRHNYSPQARKSYLARSAGIKWKWGKDTTNDKFSANHRARKDLWAAN